jgi:hypothetical protein
MVYLKNCWFLRKEIVLLPTPEWALKIVKVECALYNREVPKLKWVKKRTTAMIRVRTAHRNHNPLHRAELGDVMEKSEGTEAVYKSRDK